MLDCLCIELRIFRSSVRAYRTGNILDDRLTVGRKILGGTSGIQAIAQVFIELREERMDHQQADTIDRQPPASVARVETAHTPICFSPLPA